MDDFIPINHLSICSGIGGLDVGLGRCFPTLVNVAYVEREAFSVATLAQAIEREQIPPAPIYTDVDCFPWIKYRGLVDIVSAGLPCQPFSSAGKQRGEADSRHLWPTVRAGLEILEPSVVFFENVAGFATTNSPDGHSVLHAVCSGLEKMGYVAEAGLFSAEEVGAPHVRNRWFILAIRNANRYGKPDGPFDGEAQRVPADYEVPDPYSERTQVPIERRFAAEQESQRPLSWEAEPGMGRMVDGLPDRVDRLRSLGNAVVPQCAEHAFRTLWGRLNG